LHLAARPVPVESNHSDLLPILSLRYTKAGLRDGNWRSNYDLYQEPAIIADQESKLSGYGNTEYLKIVSVYDLKRLHRIYDGKVRRPVDLLVVTLRIATNPFQLKIDKAQVVFALRNVRPQP